MVGGTIWLEVKTVAFVWILGFTALNLVIKHWDFPGGPAVKRLCAPNSGDLGFNPWSEN